MKKIINIKYIITDKMPVRKCNGYFLSKPTKKQAMDTVKIYVSASNDLSQLGKMTVGLHELLHFLHQLYIELYVDMHYSKKFEDHVHTSAHPIKIVCSEKKEHAWIAAIERMFKKITQKYIDSLSR
jgi:hypothetical protein